MTFNLVTRVVLPLLLFLYLLTACLIYPQSTPTVLSERMVVVPAGWFLRGQNEGPRAHQPQRRIYLDAFAIDRTEVTQAAFARFVREADGQMTGWQADQLELYPQVPVVGILWREAEAYCRWAGKRLPTEAEWEKAARGADGRRYPWGDIWSADRANTAESGYGGVLPVGSFPAGASPYGVLDMAGNAAEWVADYFDFSYYTDAPERNPPGSKQVMDHSLRGGSWASPANQVQTFFRDSSHSVRPNPRVGFRCTADISQP